MPTNFKDAFARVKQLAAEFKANEKFYLSPQYQEAEVRRDFIDKFLTALGWDVNHDTQKNPYEQEVKVERREHGASQRRADYAFYIDPNFKDVKFYIEAKKPFSDIATTDNYFQAIRYGWNSQTPIAALFDFEQFEIVDCRFRPDLDTALQRNLEKFHYSQFSNEEKFAEIYWLFSREAVAAGSLEKYAESLSGKRGAEQLGLLKGGYQSIDEAFLEELDAHRNTLAHIFKKGNPQLNGEALTELTQRTLDRLVFIRFLEDKLIEPQYMVSKFGERGNAWGDFVTASRRLNGIYNGIVFKKNAILDSSDFRVDNGQFGKICEALCHVNSPYDFNAIPIHILGSIYERFLGKVIVATEKRASVKDKPAVRNAGGVYYTPEYIVRYIVDNTIGNLIEGKTPSQIAEMRFADIACGSGSFLLGIYDLLIRYHTKFYNKSPGKAKKGDVTQRDDGLHLSLQKKREILVNNIYGVDIDAQAVEVAQLSLYLKLMQDETPGSARGYQMEFDETLLPSLSKNIVCGNSLIATDILSGELFEPVEERKLNPMDYEQRFPEIIKQGGFNAIIGNPPWGALLNEVELRYLRDRNKEIIVRMIDSFMYFVHQGIQHVKPDGYFGMILPDVILYQQDNEKLREYLLRNFRLNQLLNMGDVFHRVTRPACIVIVQKSQKKKNWVRVGDFSGDKKESKPAAILKDKRFSPLLQDDIYKTPGALFLTSNLSSYSIWTKVNSVPHEKLEGLVDEDGIQRGVSPDLKEAFLVDSKTAREKALEPHKLKKTLTGGKQVKRFYIDYPDLLLIYTSRTDNFKILPNIKSFVDQFRSQITCKEVKQGKHSIYSLHRARKERIFTKAQKIVGVITEDEIIVALDDYRTYPTDGLYLFGVREDVTASFIVGVLNSQLFVFLYRLLAIEKGRPMAQVKPTILAQLPIRSIDGSKPEDKIRHDRIVSIVEQMMIAKKQLGRAQSDKDKDFYGNKCDALDRQINALVYELYGLTAQEIQIVEGTTV